MLDWNTVYKSGRDFGELPEAVLDMVLSYVDQSSSKTFLDIGCGTGHLTRLLNERGYTGLGVDPSKEAIKIAKSRSDSVNYAVFDILDQKNVPLADSYGLITCKHVYAFIADKERFLLKVSELLEANGMFVLLTPLIEDIAESNAGIAVNGTKLREGITKFYSISLDKKLKSGQLFILKKKA